MLTPLLVCFGILAVLVYKLYGGSQHKHMLQVFLSGLACTWLAMTFLIVPKSQSGGGSEAAVGGVYEYTKSGTPDGLVPVASASAIYEYTKSGTPSGAVSEATVSEIYEHNKSGTQDCDAPITTEERNTLGCSGGCVADDSIEPVHQCAYERRKECKGSLKAQINRQTRIAYSRKHPISTASYAEASVSPPNFTLPARGRIIQNFSTGGDGINIALPEGTLVKAIDDGEVAYADSKLAGYGNMIMIRHSNGYVAVYAHNSELEVKRGDKVKRGQTIAKSGQTGNVGSPQLHFELRQGSLPVDPEIFIAGL